MFIFLFFNFNICSTSISVRLQYLFDFNLYIIILIFDYLHFNNIDIRLKEIKEEVYSLALRCFEENSKIVGILSFLNFLLIDTSFLHLLITVANKLYLNGSQSLQNKLEIGYYLFLNYYII